MHKDDDKYPTRPGFEPGTSRLQAPVDTNEPSRPVLYYVQATTKCGVSKHIKHVCNSISSVLKVSIFTVYWSVYFQLAAQCHNIMFLVLLLESAVD